MWWIYMVELYDCLRFLKFVIQAQILLWSGPRLGPLNNPTRFCKFSEQNINVPKNVSWKIECATGYILKFCVCHTMRLKNALHDADYISVFQLVIEKVMLFLFWTRCRITILKKCVQTFIG